MEVITQSQRSELFRFDGSFKDPDLEQKYNQAQWRNHATRIGIVSLLTGLCYLSACYSDSLSLGGSDSFYYMMIARVITFLSAIFCVLSASGIVNRDNLQKALLCYFVCITLSECFELLLIPEIGEQGLPLLMVVILVYSLFLPVPYSYSFWGGLGASILYSTILLGIHGFILQEVFPIIASFALIIAMSFGAVRNINRAHRSEAYTRMRLRKMNIDLQREIAEKEAAQKQLQELATKDELTNAFNRRHFIERAEQERQRTEDDGQYASLLFIDIDHFKQINDTYGHAIGDLVLKKLAEVCKNSIREQDIFSRYGGEEFVMLLPEIDASQALPIAERLRKCVSETVIGTSSGDIGITISIGVSEYKKGSMQSLEALLKKADVALYKAKENGRNRVEFEQLNYAYY